MTWRVSGWERGQQADWGEQGEVQSGLVLGWTEVFGRAEFGRKKESWVTGETIRFSGCMDTCDFLGKRLGSLGVNKLIGRQVGIGACWTEVF